MRKYEKSHQWLTFNLDLNRISHNTWINLGEIKSKCEHIARTPLDPGNARKMHILFLAKGVKGTTAIEGNTLSEQEVMDKIEGKLELPPSKEYLGREIDNIVSACNSISETLLQGSPPDISCDTLLEFNRLVLNGLEVEEGIIPGQIRGYSVGVTGARYRGAPAEDCEYLMERLCSWLNQGFNMAIEDDAIIYGVLKAIISHLYIAWIHPFGDGNGRTARLLEFQILLASGMPTPAAHLLSNYYNETRQEYYRQLEKTSRTGGNIIPFIEYAITGLLEGLKKQLDLITRYVFDVSWENYIHDQFKNKNKVSDNRRRHLALDISREYLSNKRITSSSIRSISPRLAEDYAGKTARTILRDLEFLAVMGLILIGDNGAISPNDSIMLSFLPRRRKLS